MRRFLPIVAVLLACAGSVQAHGLLIPEEKTVPPLAMLNHKVAITLEDQVAVTRVEQTFRNHTDRNLEATYVFPVPKGASVNKFTMWVNGKETPGELVEAKQAREIYTSIVRRTQDPGLLEYLDNKLLQIKVFPIPAKSDQKVAISYTSVAPKDGNLVEYTYPLKTDGKATATLEEFSITATIKSQHGVQNLYSPTHLITVKRESDNEVKVTFDKNQGLLDKDFQLFYSTGSNDVGITVLTHRPIAGEAGYFTMLITPKVEMSKENEIPRDMVLVLDTSGSMRGVKMDQARKALKYCLDNLGKKDRFALINFATSVNTYRDKLLDADKDQLDQARKWVSELEATGGTAIDAALSRALEFRSKDEGRSFTIIFFTDGEPTIGETNCDKILKNFAAKNNANTRVFTFGVGDDVNATFLDRLAEQTRALPTYVRPAEDIEAKVSGLYAKISHPVLANLKLTATNDVHFNEMYPVELPDLFHGGQLVLMGRYTGKGAAAIQLTGYVGKEQKEFVYEYTFPEKTGDDHNFVEHLWARRKVGFMLDEIRAHGDKKELVDEVIGLAKKYGITTPYTSYLIVPDMVVPVAGKGRVPPFGQFGTTAGSGGQIGNVGNIGNIGSIGGFGGMPGGVPPGLRPGGPSSAPVPVIDYAKANQNAPGDLEKNRNAAADKALTKSEDDKDLGEAKRKKEALDAYYLQLKEKGKDGVQAGKLGVDLSLQMQNLRNQSKLDQSALRQVNGRTCMELGGVWIDDGFNAKMEVVTLKAQSNAYFKLLEKQPKMKEVFKLGNHLVWVTPNNTALVIDTSTGKEELSDAEIDKLFTAKK
jgi:Ca-activated chloride channel family protein